MIQFLVFTQDILNHPKCVARKKKLNNKIEYFLLCKKVDKKIYKCLKIDQNYKFENS